MRLIAILILSLFLLVAPIMAVNINVTVASVGETFIEWQWDSGYDLTHILIDGIEICGYETTDHSIIRNGFDPNSLHSINVTDDTNYGGNETYTNMSTTTNIYISNPGGDSAPELPLWTGIPVIAIAATIFMRKKI